MQCFILWLASHDDHQMEALSALLALCARNLVNSPHKGLWLGAFMFSLICAWINDWVNNQGAGDLRLHQTYYDVTVMPCSSIETNKQWLEYNVWPRLVGGRPKHCIPFQISFQNKLISYYLYWLLEPWTTYYKNGNNNSLPNGTKPLPEPMLIIHQ